MVVTVMDVIRVVHTKDSRSARRPRDVVMNSGFRCQRGYEPEDESCANTLEKTG